VQAVEGEVAGVAVLLGDAIQAAGQHRQLGGHRRPQDQLLAVVDHVLEALGSSPKRAAMAFSCSPAAPFTSTRTACSRNS
jgi:hypothetical protein